MTTARWLFLAAILVLFTDRPAAAQNADSLLLAEKASSIFRKHCLACHSGPKARGGLQILDYGQLASVLAPGRPEASELLHLVECGSMPRGTRPKVAEDELKVLRDWIAGGAPPFAAETSEDYALRHILLDVQTDDPKRDLARERYFTFNHLLGTADADPALFREALTRAINLLSWQKEFVRPTAIDATGTIFRVNLGDLGWDAAPFAGSRANLFDLILLEYPHAVIPLHSAVYEELERTYLQKAALLRPVPFVRGDWFVSAAGRSPLYEDLLRLPLKVGTLEEKLGVATAAPERAVLTSSSVLRSSRLVERRSIPTRVYWRTYDRAVIEPKGAGEMMYSLPNGLPGFFVVGADGHRFPEVTDDLLKEDVLKNERPLRNGLSCTRCHANGLEKFANATTPALEKLNGFVASDNGSFADTLAHLTGKSPGRDPLVLVDRMYRERSVMRPRNAEEIPVLPLDGLTHPDRRRTTPLKIELSAINFATKQSRTVFKPGDKMYLLVKNNGNKDVWIEMVATGRSGNVQVIPLPAMPMKLEKGAEFRFPPGEETLPISDEIGKNYCAVYVSDEPFPPGVVLSMNAAEGSDYVGDRFVHPFPKKRGDDDATFRRIEKRTVEIETRAK